MSNTLTIRRAGGYGPWPCGETRRPRGSLGSMTRLTRRQPEQAQPVTQAGRGLRSRKQLYRGARPHRAGTGRQSTHGLNGVAKTRTLNAITNAVGVQRRPADRPHRHRCLSLRPGHDIHRDEGRHLTLIEIAQVGALLTRLRGRTASRQRCRPTRSPPSSARRTWPGRQALRPEPPRRPARPRSEGW